MSSLAQKKISAPVNRHFIDMHVEAALMAAPLFNQVRLISNITVYQHREIFDVRAMRIGFPARIETDSPRRDTKP
ncbi:hypothetical protein FHS55_004071 [Angulomicrobium tetraedrale]|uniref:Uncharacterized protein n=1 Tax=Ancylobacter tetraedralis TaxID=217068 RepID=A0A839ZFN0_9HYPH|nr:hypothetical protein [Ancylobacter tetraedralis]MBB3773436.1 hypothetical protein [Ancylobacter tetraedralis]